MPYPPTRRAPSPALPPSLHPLDAEDRPVITALLEVATPTDTDLVHAARLITRYRDSRLSPDLADMLRQVLRNWSLSPSELQTRTRAIWASGWRPAMAEQQVSVGSGADVEG
ncbi:MAG: DUF3288 family protein [Steroidobacteraceae bacterium]